MCQAGPERHLPLLSSNASIFRIHWLCPRERGQPLLVFGTGKRTLLSSHMDIMFLSSDKQKGMWGGSHKEIFTFATKSPNVLSQGLDCF